MKMKIITVKKMKIITIILTRLKIIIAVLCVLVLLGTGLFAFKRVSNMSGELDDLRKHLEIVQSGTSDTRWAVIGTILKEEWTGDRNYVVVWDHRLKKSVTCHFIGNFEYYLIEKMRLSGYKGRVKKGLSSQVIITGVQSKQAKEDELLDNLMWCQVVGDIWNF